MTDWFRVLSATRFGGAVLVAAGLGACQDNGQLASGRAWKPISSEMVALMQSKGTDAHQPMLIRTFKKEAELEIWKMRPDGRYVHVKTFPMCRWSGQLGPKVREGDRQVPEGFYSITPAQMNPNSAYYLSFNVGYPNALDKALGHTGGSIMVHGACSSAGCFSMTDAQIADIYALARESFGGGQRAIQLQSFPFKMNAENLAKHRLDPNIAFWKNLKEGSDRFEVSQAEPTVGACGRKYVFDVAGANKLDPAGPCPALKQDEELNALVAEKRSRDDAKVAELVAKGVKPVRVVYADGGQHADFANQRTAEVSRVDALALAPQEIALDEPKTKSPLVKIAGAKAAKANKLEVARAAALSGHTVAEREDATATAAHGAAAKDVAPKQTTASVAASSTMSRRLGMDKHAGKGERDASEPQSAAAPAPVRRAPSKPQASLERNAAPFYGAKDSASTEVVALQPVRR